MSVIADAGLARGGGAAAGEGVVASRREDAYVCTAAETASRAAASPHPCERAAGSGVSLHVLFVAHSGYFQGTSYGGATRASLALLRHTRRLCARMDVCALVQRPTPEGLVWRLDGGGGYADGGGGDADGGGGYADGSGRSASAALGVLQWEPGVEVLVGEEGALSRAVADHHYDAVIALSLEPELLRFALKLDGARRYVLAHNYYLPPFGPFRRAEPCADHVELLAGMDEIWSPCEHHREYLLRSTTQIYRPLSTTLIYHPDLPPLSTTLIYHPDLPPRSTAQIYHPDLPPLSTALIYHPYLPPLSTALIYRPYLGGAHCRSK